MLDEHPTGVGIYSIQVINQLHSLFNNSRHTLTVFSPTRSGLNSRLHIVKLPGLLKSSRYGKLAAFSRFAWNTLYYPFLTNKFDILLSPTTHGGFGVNKQIITIHDLLSLRFDNISFHQRFYFRYLLPRMVSRARKIVAVSETTKKDIVHFLKCKEDKVQVIYNGYDEHMYNTKEKNEGQILRQYGLENYFLAIGPTYPHKNFVLLIEAYAELPLATRKEFPLVIAGGMKKYISRLQEIVSEKCLEADVHFLGYVPLGLMASLYREAYLLVFPSLFEGFGFPLLEAMACGCPVVASKASSIPEVCGNAVLYFDPYNKEELKQQILFLVNDKPLYLFMSEKGLQQVRKFSWAKTGLEWKTLIEENFQIN